MFPSVPIVQLENAVKTYPLGGAEVRALAGIDLRIDRGSFWAIMGPSGSGKSTIMNLIGCLDRLTRGRYVFNGQDVSAIDDDELSDVRLTQIGFIFQSFNLIPQLTVQKNIELPLYYLGWEADRSAARAAELGEMLGLGNRLAHRPSELSGGQQQRVAIARALANDPSLILADEPTGNLDSATGVQVLDILSKLNEEQRTIVIVTHDRDIAARARNRLHMHDGLIATIE